MKISRFFRVHRCWLRSRCSLAGKWNGRPEYCSACLTTTASVWHAVIRIVDAYMLLTTLLNCALWLLVAQANYLKMISVASFKPCVTA